MWQPAAPRETKTDTYYHSLANRLVEIAKDNDLFSDYPEKVIERAALVVVGYYQDVICDAGIWRTFISENRRMYGYTVPFYDEDGEYVDFELNRVDVRFLVWYALSMYYECRRVWYPYDPEIVDGADIWWQELDRVYDESPMPDDYRMTHELEIHAEEDSEAIISLGKWLFMHCYLMTPAYSMTLTDMASKFDLGREEGVIALREQMEQSMVEDPTGPLALYIREWLYLIVEGKRIQIPCSKAEPEEHNYFTAFTKATGGEVIKFFGSHAEMNRFLVAALGWTDGLYLPQMKENQDFILMVNREKGMLLACNIARCVAHPANPYYEKGYAMAHSMELLTERGRCPGDLLRYICRNGWLPDAVFPNSDNKGLVARNWDFIARCYLQKYYRGD